MKGDENCTISGKTENGTLNIVKYNLGIIIHLNSITKALQSKPVMLHVCVNFVNWRRLMQDWHVVDEFYLLAIILLSCVRNK